MIYFVQRANGDIKIGFTHSFTKRLRGLRQQFGEIDPLGIMDGDLLFEQELQQRFRFCWVANEWFLPDEELLEYICDNAHSCTEGKANGRLRNNLVVLMGQKEKAEGNPITAKTVAEGAGVPLAEVYRMIQGSAWLYFEHTIVALCTYLECEIGHLLYIDWAAVNGNDDTLIVRE